MNKEDLYPLIGKYLNGYKIVKVEEDRFAKGQINLWTDELIVKFYVRPNANSVKIYQELTDEENYILKSNWNKLKKTMINRFNESQDVHFLDVLQDMEELEKGNINVEDHN